MGLVGLAAEGEDGFVLKEKELVLDAARGPLLEQVLLERPCVAVAVRPGQRA